MSKILEALQQKQFAVEDSLKALSKEQIRLDSVKTNLNIANTAGTDLNTQLEKQVPLIPTEFAKSPEYYKSLVDNSLQELIEIESKTNVYDDYQEYIKVRDSINELNRNFQPYTRSFSTFTPVDSPKENRQTDGNSVDAIWASAMTPIDSSYGFENKTSIESDRLFGTLDNSLENVTKSRLVASNSKIQDLIHGKRTMEGKHEGFYDMLEFRNLDNEGDIMAKAKKLMGITMNKTAILKEALQYAHNNKSYFIDNHAVSSGVYKDFEEALSAYPEQYQRDVKYMLQNQVDKIYGTGIAIYNDTDIIDRYEKGKAKFPKYKGEGTAIHFDQHGNKDLDNYLSKKAEIEFYKDEYEMYTNSSFDIDESLNAISMNTLNKELDKLPDEDRTSNFDGLIVKLTDDIQSEEGQVKIAYQNYLDQNYYSADSTMSFKDFKKMYALDPTVYR